MRIEVIFCPSCQHKLRISEDWMGQPVQCPECRAMFLSPPPPAPEGEAREHPPAAPLEPVQSEDERREREVREDWSGADERRRQVVATRVRRPGLALLLIGIGQFLFNVEAGVQAYSSPDALRQQYQTATQAIGMPAPRFDIARLTLIVSVIFAILSLQQAVGGYAMLRRRNYGLAVVGAFAAMVNCVQICCIVGVPAGIWALAVLFAPGVRQTFR